MQRVTPNIRSARGGVTARAQSTSSDRNVRPSSNPCRVGTPGLIAPGPGFALPQLRPEHCEFSAGACSSHAAQFAQNLLRAGIAAPPDWFEIRTIGGFLNRTLQRFVGARREIIDRAFSLFIELSPTVDQYGSRDEKIRPDRVLLSFRVVDTVAWVNVTPALDLLAKEHALLPSFFYHALQQV